MAGTLEKNFIRVLRMIKCKKLGFGGIFSESGHQKFLIFCMMVEGNEEHHFSMVPHFGKIGKA